MTFDDVLAMDRADPLSSKRAEFFVPPELVYLDGNSLGCLPLRARDRALAVVEEQWGRDLIRSWNAHQWIDLPQACGAKIAPLIGAAAGQVICCDSVSVNLFKLLGAALTLQAPRHRVLSVAGNFPTDLYMVQGLEQLLGSARCQLDLVPRATLEQALGPDVAVLLMSHVDFRSGRIEDMQALTHAAHAQGVLVIWDLAHSAGVLPVQLDRCKVDFAVGCGYKYLNGGPGAPAFLYAATRHLSQLQQPLSGWMGHRSPFEFDTDYRGAEGIHKFLSGTPPVLSMSVLSAALDVFADVQLDQLRAKSLALSDLFLNLVAAHPVLNEFELASPSDHNQRGSQLAWRHPQAWSVCQALIEKGVVGDFRAPDIFRAGFSPLYLRFVDVYRAVDTLAAIMVSESWREARFQQRSRVT